MSYRHKSFCICATFLLSSDFFTGSSGLSCGLPFSISSACKILHLSRYSKLLSWWSWVIKQIEKENKQGLNSLIILVTWEIWKHCNNHVFNTTPKCKFSGVGCIKERCLMEYHWGLRTGTVALGFSQLRLVWSFSLYFCNVSMN